LDAIPKAFDYSIGCKPTDRVLVRRGGPFHLSKSVGEFLRQRPTARV
jgi:hypothetical protein